MAGKKLLRRQARLAKLLSGLNFVISYTPSRENKKADSLNYKANDSLADD